MVQSEEQRKEDQKQYYAKLNEILVKVQEGTLSQSAGEDAVYTLNNEYPNLYSKASTSIIAAMTDEYLSFDENSGC